MRPFRIGISGSYGGMNLGDEAILEVILRELGRRLPASFTVFSRDPEDTLRRHPVERAVPVRSLSRAELAAEIQPLDLLIIGGGGILYGREAAIFLRPAQIALDLDVPVMTWAVGVGPLDDADGRATLRAVLKRVAVVTVRDTESRLLLEEAGLEREVEVTADPALLLAPETFTAEMLAREALPVDARLIGISIREPGPAAPELELEAYHELLANTVDFVSERMEAIVLFVPMEHGDLREAHAVAARVNDPRCVRLLTGDYTPRQIRGLMERLEFAIGMRLHFMIFAATAGVPVIGLPYGAKVNSFARELGASVVQRRWTRPGHLLAAIDRAWDDRQALRGRLPKALSALVARAGRTTALALELLSMRRPELGDVTHAP